MLPSPRDAEQPVVILRLRGRAKVGATFVEVMSRYVQQLGVVGGRLYLSGVDKHVSDQLKRVGKLDVTGPTPVYLATSVVGQSTRRVYADAEAWLIKHPEPVETTPQE